MILEGVPAHSVDVYRTQPGQPVPCGLLIDVETKRMCGEPASYAVRLTGMPEDGPPGALCPAHAAAARHWPNVARMWSL